jgi:hypothetical protein
MGGALVSQLAIHTTARLDNPRVSESEVLARVSYQLVKLDFRRYPHRYIVPSDGVCDLANQMQRLELFPLATHLASCAYHLTPRSCSALHWRDTVVRRARIRVLNTFLGRPWKPVP